MKYTAPDLRRAAIITIDMQNDFTLHGAVAEISGTNACVPQIQFILQAARKYQMPIIHVIRLYERDGSNAELSRKEAIENGWTPVSPGSNGAQLVDALKPPQMQQVSSERLLRGQVEPIASNEWILFKPRWGAFYNTPLESFLRKLGMDTIIFTGCNFPNCPRTSIYEASERDFKIMMVKDAISAIYLKGIEEMVSIGVHVINTDQLLDLMNDEWSVDSL